MNNTVSLLAAVIQIDSHNPTWMVQTMGRQWHTKDKLVDPLAEDYVAIATIDQKNMIPVDVTAPLNITINPRVVLAHNVWCRWAQIPAQLQLWQAVADLTDPVLKHFMTGVLSDSEIMGPFYKARASKSYHHKREGELFLHSVEVAINARQMAQQHNLPQRIQECAFVGGFLHDAGKLLMHYNLDNQDKKGVNGSHEAFNFLVLADHLDQLKSQDKALFAAISAILSPQLGNKKYYDYIEESLVRSADRLSAHNYELKHVFKNKPADQPHANANGGRTYRRIGEPQAAETPA